MMMMMMMMIKIGKAKIEQFKTCKSTLYKKEFVALTNQTKTRMKTVRMVEFNDAKDRKRKCCLSMTRLIIKS